MSSFAEILANLAKPLDTSQIKHRDGDRKGSFQLAYIEWSTAADILDKYAPEWNFEVIQLDWFGETTVMCRGKLTINGVSRENVGAATVQSYQTLENTLKDAVSDCIKRCAVLFGVGRELYSKDALAPSMGQQSVSGDAQAKQYPPAQKPADPVARNLADAATPKQIGFARKIASDLGINLEDECQSFFQSPVRTDELSKKAAISFIDHLKALQEGEKNAIAQHAQAPLVKPKGQSEEDLDWSRPKANSLDIKEIEQLFEGLGLNVGQAKQLTMKILDLRYAPELKDLTPAQAKALIEGLRNQ